jgi:hypothetical protein
MDVGPEAMLRAEVLDRPDWVGYSGEATLTAVALTDIAGRCQLGGALASIEPLNEREKK